MEGAPCIEGDQGPSGGDGPGRAYGLAEPWIPSPSGNRPKQEGQSDHEQGQYRVLRFPERLRKPGGRQMHQMKDVLEEPEGADMGAGCSSRDESGQENESSTPARIHGSPEEIRGIPPGAARRFWSVPAGQARTEDGQE